MAARLTAYIVALIVGATFIAGLIVGAQRDDSTGPVDLIIYNGRVHTGAGHEPAEAVAVRGNRILRVGSNREIKRLRRAQTTYLDAHGAAVLPGFIDAHAHFLSGGIALDRADLDGAATIAEMLDRIRDYAAAHPERPWVLGRGWYYEPFAGGLPTRQQLDAVVPDRPAVMVAYDGHTSWLNSRALARAGITRHTPNPANGVIVRDPGTGEPTGTLKEAAQRLVREALPDLTREERLAALRAAIGEAHRLGVTSVQNAGGSEEELELYAELRRAGELQVRVYSALSLESALIGAETGRIDAIRQRYQDDPMLKAGAIKLMLDGVVETRTAAMLAPYEGRRTAGTPMIEEEALRTTVRQLDRNGWQILIHAIGDRAVRLALDAFEDAAAVNPEPERGRRHRIEHAETIDPEDIERFGRLGVVASMQPLHANPDPALMGLWTANLGPSRAARGWALGSLTTAGARLAFGSDWPVVSLDPRLGLHAAVNRTTPGGRGKRGRSPFSSDQEQTVAGPFSHPEAIPLDRAIDAYTSDAAWASFDEHRKGRLAPGMLADLVILSGDIFGFPPHRLLDATVTVTIVDGQVVYERGT